MANESGIVIDSKGTFSWLDDDTKYRHKIKGKGKPLGLSEKEIFAYFRGQDKCRYEIVNTLAYGSFKDVDTIDGLKAIELILERKNSVETADLEKSKATKEAAEKLLSERIEAMRKRFGATLEELGLSPTPVSPTPVSPLDQILDVTGAMVQADNHQAATV